MSWGMPELFVILVIVLVLFGAKRLPELGDGLGRFVRGLRNGLQGDDPSVKKESKTD
ncbi:MAG: twin-arginine translocase TatA/TatE family subunit [Zetaproteobacteria bacterium]|nr:MAG: twin-arginine translocase TatA/TatE family subunit [Zetaproteobacteria bacterium]